MKRPLVIGAIALLGLTIVRAGNLPAFPGAEGYGAHAVGGRGGKVYVVSTLADYDPLWEKPIGGSFRAAVAAEGPRTVVFAVSGYIDLKSQLWVFNDRLTIAGQTAPGDGICLKNYPVILRNEEVIIRYLRFRLGDASGQDSDSLRTASCHNAILDHCSISWGTDACLRVGRSSHNVTVQWCIISEALENLNNGYGAVLSDLAISLHHNLFAHCRSHNPKAVQGLVDFRNNVIYDWADMAGLGVADNRLWVNYVGNFLKPGPSTSSKNAFAFSAGAGVKLFSSNNLLAGRDGPISNSPTLFKLAPNTEVLSEPATPAGARDTANRSITDRMDTEDRGKGLAVTTEPANQIFDKVLASAGASRPRRDAADERVVRSVREGTGKLISSQQEVGGWPKLKTFAPPLDSDGDGMPDIWEQAHGLNPADASDAAAPARDGSGYSNIEIYFNSLAQ